MTQGAIKSESGFVLPARRPSHSNGRRPHRAFAPIQRTQRALPVVIAVGLAIRLYGMSLGVGMHPDERHIVMVTQSLSLADLNPHSFAYGSLPFYLLWLASRVASLFSHWLTEYDGLFYVGRTLAAVVGTGAILLTYRLARQITHRSAPALTAAALLAVNVFHIQNSHFYTVDGLLTFVSLAALIAILRVWESGTSKNHLAAGALIGLSCAVKIAGVTLCLPLAIACFLGGIRRHDRYLHPRMLGQLCLALLAAFAAFLAAEPFALLDFTHFQSEIAAETAMVRGVWFPPYTLQYVHTAPYFYPLKQIILHTMGWPLALTVLGGVVYAVLRNRRRIHVEELICLAWCLPVAVYFGALQVKFPRYLLPLYPAGIIFGAAALHELGASLRTRWGRLAEKLPATSVLAWCVLYAAAFLKLYASPHVWVTASRWIYENVPRGSVILGEHWDDKLPLSLPEGSSSQYRTGSQGEELPLYDPDSVDKMERVSVKLARADYMALPTARLYGSISRLPGRYPLTARYYRLLFSGKLGYRLIRTFHPTPSVGNLVFGDETADESFTVYDHPKVCIFKNEEKLPAGEILRRITAASADLDTPSLDQMMRVRAEGIP